MTKLAELGDFTVTRQAEGTVHGFMGKVKVSFYIIRILFWMNLSATRGLRLLGSGILRP